MKTIRIGRIGSIIKEVVLNDKCTIQEALTAAEITIDFKTEDMVIQPNIRIFSPEQLNIVLNNMDVIIIEKQKVSMDKIVKTMRILNDIFGCELQLKDESDVTDTYELITSIMEN